MAWTVSESPCELWDNVFFTFQQYAAVLFSRLYSLLATVGLACICVFSNCALLLVSQHEFHLVSHKKSAMIAWFILPFLLVLACSICSVADSNKPNAALNREKSEQKALSSFYFKCNVCSWRNLSRVDTYYKLKQMLMNIENLCLTVKHREQQMRTTVLLSWIILQ